MSKPPFRVTLLLCLVLILTVWNAIRLWTAIAWQSALNEFSAQPIAMITALSGAIWMVTGIYILWSIWEKKAWSAKLLLGATAGYTVWYWSERLTWQIPHPNWPFAIIVNLVLIIFILFITRSLPREAYERKIENPKID
jgi:hypothetical protein